MPSQPLPAREDAVFFEKCKQAGNTPGHARRRLKTAQIPLPAIAYKCLVRTEEPVAIASRDPCCVGHKRKTQFYHVLSMHGYFYPEGV